MKIKIKGQHHLRLYFLVDVVRCASLSVRLQNTFINNISGINLRFFALKYPMREVACETTTFGWLRSGVPLIKLDCMIL